jgi:Flp pilus assembly protein TadB
MRPAEAVRRQLAGRRDRLLEALALCLVSVWMLALLGGYTSSASIHILLALAIALLLTRLVRGTGNARTVRRTAYQPIPRHRSPP